jgi:hypothetical protein
MSNHALSLTDDGDRRRAGTHVGAGEPARRCRRTASCASSVREGRPRRQDGAVVRGLDATWAASRVTSSATAAPAARSRATRSRSRATTARRSSRLQAAGLPRTRSRGG